MCKLTNYRALRGGYGESPKNADAARLEEIMTKTYKIDVDCANCAAKMEEATKKTAGVKNANVNFMLLKMTVDFEDGADEKKVMKDVLKNCRKVEDDCEIEF